MIPVFGDAVRNDIITTDIGNNEQNQSAIKLENLQARQETLTWENQKKNFENSAMGTS